MTARPWDAGPIAVAADLAPAPRRSVALASRGVLVAFMAIVLVCWSLGAAGTARAQSSVRSVTVMAVASARSFDTDLPELQYAEADLDRFAGVMTATGGQPVVIKAVGPTRAAFRDAFVAARRAGTADGKFVFYYTGHADAEGLHLADGRLTRQDLHELLASVPAATRVAILDSCYSGALAAKGVRSAPGFAVPRAEFDEPSGSVFLAATSATDAAFEVDELRGSLFTHYLVDGMYGQGDADGDGAVTLDELYRHVYREMTLHGVLLPGGAPQRPEYKVELKGRGSLVMATPTGSGGVLVLGPELAGEVTLASTGGLLVFKVTKADGAPRPVAVPAGEYRVVIRAGDRVGRGAVTLVRGGERRLVAADLTYEEAPDLRLVSKGKIERPVYGVTAGYSLGMYPVDRGGPWVELRGGTEAVRLRRAHLRAVGAATARQATLRGVSGTANEVGGNVGVAAALATPWASESQHLVVPLLVGMARYDMRADDAPPRRIRSTLTKVSAGLGWMLETGAGRAWRIDWRREWSFATVAGTDDVLSLTASIVGVGVDL